MRFAGRTVAITGGTKGIGEGCVEVFAEAGADVVFCGLEPELGETVAARVSAAGPGKARFLPCDVTRHDQLRAFIHRAVDTTGRLDCLINNAGHHPPHRPIDEFSVDDFRALLELNLISLYVACKAALPWLRQSRGSIANIASLVATLGQRHATTYVATKGAVLSFTKALATRRGAPRCPRERYFAGQHLHAALAGGHRRRARSCAVPAGWRARAAGRPHGHAA